MNVLKFWKQCLFFHIRLWEGEGGSGGGSGEGGSGEGGSGEGGDKKFTQSDVEKAVNEAVGGLKTKNDELLGKTKKLQEQLQQFDGIDPEKMRSMLKRFEDDEEAKLLAEGKVEELVEKRLSKATAQFDEKYSAIVAERDDFEGKWKISDAKYNKRVINEVMMKAAVDAGVRSEAIEDIVIQSRDIFTVGEDEELEARDKDGNLRKIGEKLLTPKTFIESLKETKPHYWPDSQGAGAQGRRGESGGMQADIDAKLQAAAASGNMKEYRRLRDEQRKASSGGK